MEIRLVAALGRNGEIGQDGRLPWPHLRSDMKRFCELTRFGIVVMGRRTWESLPLRPLPYRTNIVLTQHAFRYLEHNWVHGIDPGRTWPARPDKGWSDAKVNDATSVYNVRFLDQVPRGVVYGKRIFVIGGACIYRLFLQRADYFHLTCVAGDFPQADTFFPGHDSDPKSWSSGESSRWPWDVVESSTTREADYDVSFFTLKRNRRPDGLWVPIDLGREGT